MVYYIYSLFNFFFSLPLTVTFPLVVTLSKPRGTGGDEHQSARCHFHHYHTIWWYSVSVNNKYYNTNNIDLEPITRTTRIRYLSTSSKFATFNGRENNRDCAEIRDLLRNWKWGKKQLPPCLDVLRDDVHHPLYQRLSSLPLKLSLLSVRCSCLFWSSQELDSVSPISPDLLINVPTKGQIIPNIHDCKVLQKNWSESPEFGFSRSYSRGRNSGIIYFYKFKILFLLFVIWFYYCFLVYYVWARSVDSDWEIIRCELNIALRLV